MRRGVFASYPIRAFVIALIVLVAAVKVTVTYGASTVLGNLAASMKPGTWAQSATNNINPTLSDSQGASVRFGIGIPQVQPGARADVEGLHRFLARVEELGFDSAWVLEQPVGTAPTLAPTALLAHAAAVTSR